MSCARTSRWLTEENHCKGMSAEEARYTARRALSGIEQTKKIDPERRGLVIVRDGEHRFSAFDDADATRSFLPVNV